MLRKTTPEIMAEEMAIRENDPFGRKGDSFEIAIRSLLSKRRVHKVKREGAPDLIITRNGQRISIEIKTACGTVNDTYKADYVIYCPDVDITYPAEMQGYVFTQKEWRAFLNGYTGRGKFLKENRERNTVNIQSFYVSEEIRPKASKPIANYIWNSVFEMPMVCDMEEWI